MTPYDFRAQLAGLLNRQPLAPVAIDLSDGRRVVVDAPEQVRATFEGVTIRQASGRRVDVPADAVRLLSRYDDLPAEVGRMSYRAFYEAVRPLLRAEPFTPFVVELADGGRVPIDRPALLLAGRHGVYLPAGDGPYVRFRTEQVSAVTAQHPAGVA